MLYPPRFLNKVETLVETHLPVKSDLSMKLIFGDQRLWPSVVARLLKVFPPGNKHKYDMMVIRKNILHNDYVKSRTLTEQGRRRGKSVSQSM